MGSPLTIKERQKRMAVRRREAGLCVTCGGQPPAGKSYCDDCLAKRRRVSAERRSKGLCYCGRPAILNTARCPNCTVSVRKAKKKVSQTRKAKGLCTVCGAEKSADRLRCEPCDAVRAERERRRIESGMCRCGRAQMVEGKTFCQACIDRILSRLRALRESVVQGYGGRCACCGDADPIVLEVDHVNGDGNKHRRDIKSQGIYRWAIRNKFPDSLQLLCASCHTAKTKTGDCSYRRDWIKARKRASR